MASTSDARASGFDAATFRDSIQFAMNMGLPETASERCTFRWTPEKDYRIEDPGGNPYDFTATNTPTNTVAPADVQVDAAVEFVSRSTLSQGTALGELNTPRATITLLDVDYALVEGADQVLLGGNTYDVDYVAPPVGLFEVTIYQIHCSAVDES